MARVALCGMAPAARVARATCRNMAGRVHNRSWDCVPLPSAQKQDLRMMTTRLLVHLGMRDHESLESQVGESAQPPVSLVLHENRPRERFKDMHERLN